jgi:SSS family transporter
MPQLALGTLDWAMIGAYALVVIGIGLWLARREGDAEQYFLAGRRMTWPLIGVSLFASNISSTTLVGLSGSAYGQGIAVYNYEWMAALVLVVFAVFFLPFYLRARVFTIPEYLERRFDRRARYYFAALTPFLNIVVDTAGSLYAGRLVVQLIFPELPLWQIIAALALVAGIYTTAGGLAAVMVTDALQAILLVFGACLISVLAWQRIDGWEAVLAVTSPEELSLILPAGNPHLPWPGLVTGVFLIGFYFWGMNQFMVQRMLSARDIDHGRWGALFAGLLKLPVLFIMVMPGLMARVLYPELPEQDLVFPTLMFDLLPVGLLGLVLAGLLAALMSSIGLHAQLRLHPGHHGFRPYPGAGHRPPAADVDRPRGDPAVHAAGHGLGAEHRRLRLPVQLSSAGPGLCRGASGGGAGGGHVLASGQRPGGLCCPHGWAGGRHRPVFRQRGLENHSDPLPLRISNAVPFEPGHPGPGQPARRSDPWSRYHGLDPPPLAGGAGGPA